MRCLPLLASTAIGLGLAGTIGNANAQPIDATSLTIWTGLTPGQNINSANQQALPFAGAPPPGFANGASLPGLPLLGTFNPATPGPINFSYGTTTPGVVGTILGFLSSSPSGAANPLAVGCTGACASNTNISGTPGFNAASLFEFDFTAPSNGTLTITHDDGISLFVAGTETGCITYPATNANCTGDLFPLADSVPQFTGGNSGVAVNLVSGHTYDLWYTAANSLPEVLETDFNTVPEPATLALFGTALVGLGAIRRRRNRV